MTIQVIERSAGKSKRVLEEKLNAGHVFLHDPSVFPGGRGSFSSQTMLPGEYFPVVMDHPKRSRFAIIRRGIDGRFKVS